MLTFDPITAYPKGTLSAQLADAYSFHPDCKCAWARDWQEYDGFMYGNPQIAHTCGFITVLDGKPIGHITWDPRSCPHYVIIGHNCILTAHKGHGYGQAQLQEALRRIRAYDVPRVKVTTNALFLPAQRNYERAGFVCTGRRPNPDTPFCGDYIDYELLF